MILPSSKWVAKATGYVHDVYFSKGDVYFSKGDVYFSKGDVYFSKGDVYFSKGDVIKIESIIIGEYDAKVTFNHNSNRLTIDAMFFRKKFEGWFKMVNMHIILKGKKDDIAVRYYEDDIINLRLFPYTTINKFYFKEVE